MLVPLSPFITIVLIVFFVVYFRYKKQAVTQVTLQKMLDNQQPIPEVLLEKAAPSEAKPLRKAIVFISGGVGLILATLLSGEHWAHYWSWGLLPLFVGLGYLLIYKLND